MPSDMIAVCTVLARKNVQLRSGEGECGVVLKRTDREIEIWGNHGWSVGDMVTRRVRTAALDGEV